MSEEQDKNGTAEQAVLAEKQVILKQLREAPEFFTLLSLCSKEPYVCCDPETYDDEILIFLTQEDTKAAAGALINAKVPVNPVKIEEKQKLNFLLSLFSLGVNALLVKTKEKSIPLQLNEVIKRENPAEQKDGSVWIENPELHLTMLYYAQESRRPAEQNGDLAGAKQSSLKAMQEEILADFQRGKFIVPSAGKEKGIPLVKLEDEKLYQPLFTDMLEFKRFNKDNQFQPLGVSAEKIPQVLPQNAQGVLLNPMGVKMPLTVQRQPKPAAEKQAE